MNKHTLTGSDLPVTVVDMADYDALAARLAEAQKAAVNQWAQRSLPAQCRCHALKTALQRIYTFHQGLPQPTAIEALDGMRRIAEDALRENEQE
jgi:hypothetical protein